MMIIYAMEEEYKGLLLGSARIRMAAKVQKTNIRNYMYNYKLYTEL
jgi:hypothetical protein